MAHIGIIGGGISGLTVAWQLHQLGHRVDLYEASERIGGAIRTTISPDGWMAEWGPNTIIESSRRIKKLVRSLDLDHHKIYPGPLAKKRYIVRNGEMVAVPSSLYGIITTPMLSAWAKCHLLAEPFRARNQTLDSETVADFVRRRVGDEFLKWPIDALVGGIYAGDPERLSVRHAFPRLALLEEQHGSLILGQLKGGVRRPPGSDEIPRNKADIFSFDKGLQLLPDTLAQKLGESVHTSLAAERLEQTPDKTRWQIHFSDSRVSSAELDAVIYAGTADGLTGIRMPDKLTELLYPVAEIPHPPVTTLTLGFRREQIAHSLDGFGVLIPGTEGFPILGTLFTSSLFPGRAPDEKHAAVTCFFGGTRQPQIAKMVEGQQIHLALQSLEKLLGLRGSPLYAHRICWPRAIPQYELDFGRFIRLMDQAEQDYPGLYLAGNYRTGISVGDTINAAMDLAVRVHTEIQASKSKRTHT